MSICDAVAADLLGHHIPLVDHAQQTCTQQLSLVEVLDIHTQQAAFGTLHACCHFAHDTYTMEWFRGASVGTKLVTGITAHTHTNNQTAHAHVHSFVACWCTCAAAASAAATWLLWRAYNTRKYDREYIVPTVEKPSFEVVGKKVPPALEGESKHTHTRQAQRDCDL